MTFPRFAALCLALALFWCRPAAAFDTPLQAPGAQHALERIGKAYQHYASGLGCTEFVWGNIAPDNSQFTLKYLPKEATGANWTKMVVITVNGMSGDKTADTDTIAANILKLETQYKKAATVTEDQNYMSMQQELQMFMQYSFGTGEQKIYGAAVYMRTTMMPAAAAFIQLQSRAGPLPPQEVLNVHHMVNPTAKLPGDDQPKAP